MKMPNELLELLNAESIHSNNYVIAGYPTSYRERIIAQGQQIARIDREKDCFLIKPNLKEFSEFFEGVEINPMNDNQMTLLTTKILNEGNIDDIVIALGASGCFVLQKGTPPRRLKSQKRQVFDVSGAGDTFLGCFRV